MMKVESVTDPNFKDDVIDHEGYVLVSFYRNDDAEVLDFLPMLDMVADRLGDEVKVVKMNIVANKMVPSQMDIREAVFVLFKDGFQIDKKLGYIGDGDLADLYGWLENKMKRGV